MFRPSKIPEWIISYFINLLLLFIAMFLFNSIFQAMALDGIAVPDIIPDEYFQRIFVLISGFWSDISPYIRYQAGNLAGYPISDRIFNIESVFLRISSCRPGYPAGKSSWSGGRTYRQFDVRFIPTVTSAIQTDCTKIYRKSVLHLRKYTVAQNMLFTKTNK